MPITIPNVTGDLVLSRGECAYQEVLNGFKDADCITVVTFNISKKDDTLLSALRGLDATVRVIAAIPGRLDKYWGSSATALYLKRNAADSIHLYLRKLSPEQFGPLASVSFCFNNHAKIIMTDKIAYVGSANFSEESINNWEAGFIVRDALTIKKLNEFVNEIEGDSIRYYGEEMLDKIVPLAAARQRLTELNEKLAEDFEQIERKELKEAVDQLRDAIADSDRVWSDAFEEWGPVYSRINTITMSRVEDWFDESSTIAELDEATVRMESAERGDIDAGELPVNNDGIIPDSAFDAVVENLQIERECQVDNAQSSTIELQAYITQVCQQIDDVCRDIAGNIEKIDNTKKH